MSILMLRDRGVYAVQCDDCGELVSFLPFAYETMSDAREAVAIASGWTCRDDRDARGLRDRCPKCSAKWQAFLNRG